MGLTLGPVLFNWAPETWRDFHFRIADEAPVDTVVVGETVCPKRAPFLEPHLPAVIERLAAAGKAVVLSTPALVQTAREEAMLHDLAEGAGDMAVEANDMAAVSVLRGRPHHLGPGLNIYNEGTLAVLAAGGAARVCLPPELAAGSIGVVARAGRALGVETEVLAFGRMPLAISARCYHARAHGLTKDSCQYVCAQDPDGLDLDTLDGEPFLAVNGVQTLSHACLSLAAEAADLRARGVARLRLSPQTVDMVAVARLFRDLLDGREDGAGVNAALAGLAGGVPLANGFYHGRAGAEMAPPD
ncbi:MAG: U32 family peptidase [Rhodobacterales bacterium]|nr:U32 family peptidase [Rhodobacterales bacterium]